MQAVRRTGTAPELELRKALRARGLRFSLNKTVGGTKPDIAFSRAKVALFIDGCWWHGCPTHYRPPSHNRAYWIAKVERNRARDRRNDRELRRAGWTSMRFWSCQVKTNAEGIARRVVRRVESRASAG